MSSSNGTDYDCVACGQCCYHGKPDYVFLYPEDLLAFGPTRLARYTAKPAPSAERLSAGEDGSEIYMRMENGHCCALNVDRGVSYICSIYEDRPLLCRMFEPKSADCLDARARPTRETPRDLAR